MLGRAGGSRMSKCRRRDSAMYVIGDGRVYKMEVRNKEQSVSDLAGSEAGFLEVVDAASIVAYCCRSSRYAEISNAIKKMG